MNKYKLGKDIGSLMERVSNLEKSKKPCGCSESSNASNNRNLTRGVSNEILFESLKAASPNEEVYTILKQLVTEAGHITIRELFACSAEDVGKPAANAITMAKTIGFLALSNDKCCHEVDDPFTDDYCTTNNGKWCSLVKKTTKYMCTLASDKC